MSSSPVQEHPHPITSRPSSPGLRYFTCCGVELEPNKHRAIFSNPVQESPDPINSQPASPGLRYSTGCEVEVEPESSNHQQELDSFSAIPLHILSTLQTYFLTTVPSPGKLISINLVPSPQPIPSSLSDHHLSSTSTSRMEELAIPEHVLEPLQEYFSNRRTNPEQFPKYVGVRITQEDARVYENVLGCCERGCLEEVIFAKEGEGASEEVGQDACEERAEGVDEIVGHDSGEYSGLNPGLVSNMTSAQ